MDAAASIRAEIEPDRDGAAARPAAQRVAALDAARGIAVLAMFVAHGYDGWLAAPEKAGVAYRVTRELAAVAMPSFVVFAGLGLGLRMARTDAGDARSARRAAIARGLQLLLAGYALSLAYALIDGGLTWTTVLRADALHAIGASLALCAAALPWSGGAGAAASLRVRAVALALLLLALTRWLTLALHDVTGPSRYALAPWVHVDGLSRFSALPLAALAAAGVALAHGGLPRRLSSPRAASTLAIGAALLAGAFWLATAQLVQSLGGALSPAHAAVLPNALDGLCRALCALGLGALATLRAPAALRAGLTALGRRSLWIYALHLPLCYGALSKPLRARLDFAEAGFALAALALTSAALAWLSLRARLTARG